MIRGVDVLIVALGLALGAGCEPRLTTPPSPASPSSHPSPQPADAPGVPRPSRLVVLIVIDQMPAELVERLGPTWTRGLRRALDAGLVFTHAEHAHARTYTAPGHASLVTGVYPRTHGVVTNDWLDVDAIAPGAETPPGPGGPWVSPIEDPAVSPVGADVTRVGRRGAPRLLMAETVGDWLHDASPSSRVIAVAGKDRAAILMGGPTADLATWFDPAAGAWISSTHYVSQPPEWLAEVARTADVDGAAAAGWSLRDPPSTYARSRPDAAPFEQFGGTFPHDARAWGSPARFFKSTWHGDASTVDVAIAAIDGERLGARGAPDLLLIGLSAPDYVGHAFGPHSREIEDHYRRLDDTLDRLWLHLDAAVADGRLGTWVAILTSDHGVAPMPEHPDDVGGGPGRTGARVDFHRIAADHPPAALEACPATTEIHVDRGFRLRFGPGATSEVRDRCARAIAAALETEPAIERAFSHAELEGRGGHRERAPDHELFARGHYAGRSPEITVRLRPRDVRATSPTGTRHGSAHAYDREVPLLVLRGDGAGAGQVGRPVAVIDVAPTLAHLLGVVPPPELDGSVLPEIAAQRSPGGNPAPNREPR